MKKTFFVWLTVTMLLPLAGGEIIFHSGFDSQEEFALWKAVPGWSYSADSGRNGTGAALLTRDKFSGPLTSVKLDSLKPGVLYRLTVWIKPEVESDGKSRNYGAFCIEFVKDGKWMSGYYPQNSNLSGQWQKCSLEFILKPGAEQTSIVLYIRKGFKGTIRFDDVVLEEAGDPKAAILITSPSQLTFFGTSGELKISGCSSGTEQKSLAIRVWGNGFEKQDILQEYAPGMFKMPLKDLPTGELNVEMSLRSSDGKKVISRANSKIFVRTDGRQKSNFDVFGNMWIDGKKFMPIGIFGGFSGVDDLEKISAAGFNTIINYSSFGMTFGSITGSRMMTVLNSLDEIQKHGLKLLFSLKDQYPGMRHAVVKFDDAQGIDEVVRYTVNSLKNHPALLGWYVSDENSRSEMPAMVALRELIALHDPDHPAVTLTFREGDLPVYGQGGDVLAVDHYPIISAQDKQLTPLISLLKTARLGRQPRWMVPQIFNWGVYRAKNEQEFSQFVYPERKEIKAMILTSVIWGCKGFIFYSYSDICGSRGRRFFPENEAVQWENTVAAAAMLKRLESFIISDHIPEIIVDNGPESVGILRNDNGKKIFIAVRSDSGKSQLPLAAGEEYILLDGSAEFIDGKWFFTGKDIDFCILAEK